jgi:hypothetical protein
LFLIISLISINQNLSYFYSSIYFNKKNSPSQLRKNKNAEGGESSPPTLYVLNCNFFN